MLKTNQERMSKKRPYKARGRPEKNPRRLRQERAWARGASRPGTAPNPPA